MRQMAIWIDHQEARVFHVTDATFEELTVPAPHHHLHRHPKSQETRGHNHPQDDSRFFDDVVRALAGAEEILVVGPSVTKLRFLRYAQEHVPGVASHVVGLETADHPTDRQLVAHIRDYFHIERPRIGLAPV
jgi:stalled ribosome rescue protein Dom34